MSTLSRWLAPVVLAAGFGMAALAPAPAHAQSGDDLARVIVDVADVIFRSGTPYYRQGNYGYDDRLIVVRDRYGRASYYREVPRHVRYRTPARYVQHRPAPHYYARPAPRHVKCNKHGKCKVKGHYYDARYDRDGDRYSYDDRYDRDHRRRRDRHDD